MSASPASRTFVFSCTLIALATAAVAQQDWRRTPNLLPVSGGSMAQGPVDARIVRFGCASFQFPSLVPLDVTYLWDGASWSEAVGVVVRPPARFVPLMTYDNVRQRTVMFGGYDIFNKPLHDTWEWDGAQWTEVVSASSPLHRRDAGMAFDGSSVIFFGGDVSGATSTETWSYDGSNWSLLFPVTSPDARVSVSMTSGPGEILMFGDGPLISSVPAETWRWDGANWSQVNSATVPPRRLNPALSYDPVLGRYLLYGSSVIPRRDTWQLMAGQWSELSAQRDAFQSNLGAAAFHYPTNRWVASSQVANPTGYSITYEFGTDLGWVTSYGVGCSSTAGVLRLNLVGGQPRPGDTVQLELSTVIGFPLLALGWSDTVGAMGPLPFSLAAIGATAPNCDLLQSSDVIYSLPMQPESVANIAIPNNPVLVGSVFYAQGFELPFFSLSSLRASAALACGIDRF